MALNQMPLTQFNTGTLKLLDGTGVPLTVTLQLDQGTASASGLKPNLREGTAYEARGVLIATRQTTRVYPTLSFSSMIAEMSEAAAGTVQDMLHATAGTPYAARVSTRTGDLICLDVELCIEGTDYDGVDVQWKFEDVHISWDYSQGNPDQASFSGVVYGNITSTGGGIAITAA